MRSVVSKSSAGKLVAVILSVVLLPGVVVADEEFQELDLAALMDIDQLLLGLFVWSE